MKQLDIANRPKTCPAMTLSQASAGCTFRIQNIQGPSCQHIRRMGFSNNAEIKKVSNGHNLICTIFGTKIALNRKLADQILVYPT